MSCSCECHDPNLHMGWGGPDRHCSHCAPQAESERQVHAYIKTLEKQRDDLAKALLKVSGECDQYAQERDEARERVKQLEQALGEAENELRTISDARGR